MPGITDGINCLTKGDLAACGSTAITLAMTFSGGLVEKIGLKYALHWGKAARLGKELWKLGKDIVSDIKGLMKWGKEAHAAEDAAKAGDHVAEACGNSFTKDTPVVLGDKTSKPIAQIKIGDKVLATDPATGKTQAEPVTALIRHHGPHRLVTLTLADHTQINATDHHPIYDATTAHYTDAMDLQAGHWLREDDGRLIQLLHSQTRQLSLTAYNLTIGTLHTYYAGTSAVLVHNCARKIGNSLTPAQTDDLARWHGFKPIAGRSHGQRIYQRGRTFISRDADGHSPGVFKMADSPRALRSKATRFGTVDEYLNRIGD